MPQYRHDACFQSSESRISSSLDIPVAGQKGFQSTIARADHLVSESFLTVNTFWGSSDRELVSMFHRKVDAEKKTYRCWTKSKD